MEIHSSLRGQYSKAAEVMEAIHHTFTQCVRFRPDPPLKRSDVFALAAVAKMQKQRGHVTAGQLAHAMHQTPSGISQKVCSLERAGFLGREHHSGDRRVVYLHITPSGERTMLFAMREILQSIDDALETLGAEKTGELTRLLGELDGILQSRQAQAGSHAEIL